MGGQAAPLWEVTLKLRWRRREAEAHPEEALAVQGCAEDLQDSSRARVIPAAQRASKQRSGQAGP